MSASAQSQWLTVQEFARMMGRCDRQVRKWTSDGTLIDFGYPMYVFGTGRFNRRTYILTPPL